MTNNVYLPKIMIVNDMSVNLRILSHSLEHTDEKRYQIFTFNNPVEAKAKLLEINPDIILLDVEMPEINGIELCHYIKTTEALCDIPVIFVTSLENDSTIIECFKAGANDFLNKPVNPIELNLRVEGILKTHFLKRELYISHKSLAKKISDHQNVVNILCNDVLALELMQKNTQKKLLKLVENMPEAVDLINKTQKATEQAMHIIRNISVVNLINESQKEVITSPIEIRECLVTSIKNLQHKIREKSHKISIQYNDLEEAKVFGQKDLIIQDIFENILNNAIKFTPNNGEITCSINRIAKATDIIFIDNGIGISPEIIKSIFNQYSLITSTDTNGEKGTGLGLPLAKHVIEKFGGDIFIEQGQDKKGTKITCRFVSA